MSLMADSISLPQRVVAAIREVVGSGSVALHEPNFLGNEWRYLKECLNSTYVSSVGKYVDQFEAELAAFTGARYAVAVVNGTAALHIALKVAGVKANDEVLIPALTFVATANAVTYCGAVPHLLDSEESTLGLDAVSLRCYLQNITEQRSGQCINRVTGRVIRAIVPMHTFGHPADMDGLLSVAHDFGLVLIEDAAESLGSYYSGRHTGTFGLMGTLSFNGNKTITTGGGGAILTSDEAIARRVKHLTTTAKMPHAWEYRHDECGYNYRLPNLNAALGCAQLERLGSMLDGKRKLHRKYSVSLEGIRGLKLMTEPARCRSNYWLQTLVLDFDCAIYRDEILKALNDAGFMARPAWALMNELSPFYDCPRMDLGCAQSLVQRLINIPSSPQLGWGEG